MKSPDKWGNGLRWRLQATRRVWARGSRPTMQMLVPDRSAAVPEGRFDYPFPGALLHRTVINFTGWALFPDEATARVELRLGGHELGAARLCAPRPDVLESTEIPYAGVSGFDLTVDLARWPGDDGYTEIDAVATSVGGRTLELEPVPAIVAPLPIEFPVQGESARVAIPALPSSPHEGLKVLVFTHQLDLGGAQLYLLDLLAELLRRGGFDPTVVSALDGPMRVRLEEMGIPVMITGAPSMDNFEAHLERVDEMAAWAADRGFEAVFVNTATALTFHGAEIAAALQIPVVWAIHESFEPARLWAALDRSIRRRAEAALGEASAVIFEAEATRALFESKVGEGRASTLAYGLDLGPIDSRRASLDRDAERRAEEIPPDAEVVLCIGTIEPRKGQVALAQAFELIADRHPDARLVFVGGRNDEQTRLLTDFIDSCSAAGQIRVVPVTPDVQRWHGISDLFVSASDIESLPRTVLEAMAWERPVLASAVFGLPELIDDGETGWLCEPLDVSALSAALDRVLGTPPEVRARIAAAARALVEERHSLPVYAGQVGELLERAVGEPLAEPRQKAVGE